MKFPFMMLDDGMVVVHDHDSGEVLEKFEGVAKSFGEARHSFWLLGFEGSERFMVHLGFDEESAFHKLAAMAIGAAK